MCDTPGRVGTPVLGCPNAATTSWVVMPRRSFVVISLSVGKAFTFPLATRRPKQTKSSAFTKRNLGKAGNQTRWRANRYRGHAAKPVTLRLLRAGK